MNITKYETNTNMMSTFYTIPYFSSDVIKYHSFTPVALLCGRIRVYN